MCSGLGLFYHTSTDGMQWESFYLFKKRVGEFGFPSWSLSLWLNPQSIKTSGRLGESHQGRVECGW